MTERVDLILRIAKRIWFEYVDDQGYPNGLPTWDEMAKSSDYNTQRHVKLMLVQATEALRIARPDLFSSPE